MTITKPTQEAEPVRASRAFDIRLMIAALFTLYGVTLALLGLTATTSADVAKAAGLAINLWTGAGMLLFSGLFALWAWLRPIRVAPHHSAESPTDQ